MTTAIRTSYGDVRLAESIENFFWETFCSAPDTDACMEAVRDYITEYVNTRLPDNLTWFPSLSEVYVEIDDDTNGSQSHHDVYSVDDLICDLVWKGIEEADNMLAADPNAFGPVID